MFGVIEIWLYCMDSVGNLVWILCYFCYVEFVLEGGQWVEEQLEEEMVYLMDILFEVEVIFDSVWIFNKVCIEKLVDDQYLICYLIYGGWVICGFFVLCCDYEFSGFEVVIVQGVLEVFNNFYGLFDMSQCDWLMGLFNCYLLEFNFDWFWNLLYVCCQIFCGDNELCCEYVVFQVYWFGVMDVDYFKIINDMYGYMIGDEVLIIIGCLLELVFCSLDLFYCYGGEEFIVIIVVSDVEVVVQIFECVCCKIEVFKFLCVGCIMISGGFSWVDFLVLLQEVINCVDWVFYEFKNFGCNCFCEYESLVVVGVIKVVDVGSVDFF